MRRAIAERRARSDGPTGRSSSAGVSARDVRADRLDHVGLTPACAGNTTGRRCRCRRRRAHPRMGGEHSRTRLWRGSNTGSPPHGRGTLAHEVMARLEHGLTPSWAGNTRARGYGEARTRAHPRMGGEHSRTRLWRGSNTGSPPHGRGTLAHEVTWAGNTQTCRDSSVSRRAHPRMGGEHSSTTGKASPKPGSPPHGRGTPRPNDGRLDRIRAHPRMGGEHARHGDRAGAVVGLTPAWAGNTGSGGSAGSTWTGSPPHGRGTLGDRHQSTP